MGEFGDYFESWNWELGFRDSRNVEENALGGVPTSSGLREALLDTNPATAFNPFLGFLGRNSKAAISRVYVTLLRTVPFELRLGYLTINGNLFNLPAGPVSFAIGAEHRGERGRFDPSSAQTTFDAEIGDTNTKAPRANRDVWATYQELRFPVTSPSVELPRRPAPSSILPSAKNGTAKTPMLFCPSITYRLSRGQDIAGTMHRSRNSLCAGSLLIPSGSAL